MKINKEDIIERISSMSLIEIIELISSIEKKFGISSENYKSNNIKSENKKIKKDKFNIYLNSIGNNKISVIKIVRNFLGLGLKESKDLVESCPVLIKEKVNKKNSDLIKKSLEDVGAKIIIK